MQSYMTVLKVPASINHQASSIKRGEQDGFGPVQSCAVALWCADPLMHLSIWPARLRSDRLGSPLPDHMAFRSTSILRTPQ